MDEFHHSHYMFRLQQSIPPCHGFKKELLADLSLTVTDRNGGARRKKGIRVSSPYEEV